MDVFRILDIICPYLSFIDMDTLVYSHPKFRREFTTTGTFANMMIGRARKRDKSSIISNLKIERKLYKYNYQYTMSLTDMYGIKISYREMQEIMRKEYEKYINYTPGWYKYVLIDMVAHLKKDMLKIHPDYKFGISTTGFLDEAGPTIVIGVITCQYLIKGDIFGVNYRSNEYDDAIRKHVFSKWCGGHGIHHLPCIYRVDQDKLVAMIKYMKKLINHDEFDVLPAEYYKVENYEC